MVVILFMGFPEIFQVVMVSLHLPVVALLVGVVVRGTTFTFRHYDAIHDEKSQTLYSRAFGLSSLWTAFWLGVIGGALALGHIDRESTDFWIAYIDPWISLFTVSVGFFVIAIFSFLASVYLVGETEDPELKAHFLKRGFLGNVAVVILGGVVFLTSWWEGMDLVDRFWSHPVSLVALIFATLLFFLLWKLAREGRRAAWVRVTAAAQVTLILFGYTVLQGTALIQTRQGPLEFQSAAAPEATQFQLVLALLVGSLFIFPALYFLLRVFKTAGSMNNRV
jgi:cytochrome d ubiquinol oxidase subunit II